MTGGARLTTSERRAVTASSCIPRNAVPSLSRATHCRGAAGNSGQRAATGRPSEVRPNVDYVVIIEKGETSYGAYVPDLPGCVAVGETREAALDLIREAIEFHREGLPEVEDEDYQ